MIANPVNLDSEHPLVLVIDDDAFNLEVFKAMVISRSLECDAALSGAIALSFVKERVKNTRQESHIPMYQLLLLDYSMPEMNGIQFMAQLKTMLADEGVEVPYVCCCTAYAEESFKNKALAAGMDNFLTKPVSAEEFDKALGLV